LTSPVADAPGAFVVLPAIDLRSGRVVRLIQGDFDRETAYGEDPVGVAEAFAAAGARWLHIVDLDGARSGEPAHLERVTAMTRAVAPNVRCEVAGGLRTAEAVRRALDAGAARVVVGTAALRDPAFAADLVERHGADAVVVSLDVRNGLAVGEGWRDGASGLPVEEALVRLAAVGARRFEVTAIDRDGLLGGPDLVLLRRLVALGAGEIIASGGVSSLGDLRAVRGIGCAGAIVGRALYEGRLDLGMAIQEMASAG
jgi:phosphoribosylformimino-5-aminoimidazole carboxamide ribotide isomerase